MINRNKVSKYLLYAIGEIILVVIGILIALQINNWNEERKLKKLEVSYYKNLLTDFEKDSVEFDFQQFNAEITKQKLLNIMRFIESGYDIGNTEIRPVEWGPSRRRFTTYTDTSALGLSLSQAGFLQFPKLFENTITDLRATGNLKLFQNGNLKDDIIIYYNREKMHSEWIESYIPNRTQIDLAVNRILPVEVRTAYTLTHPDSIKDALSINNYDKFIEAIKTENELKGLTSGMIHIQSRIRYQSARRIKEVSELMKKIREELEYLEPSE